ncbi:carbohydrate ABC transporter permease [Variovorax sp. OV329]|uniref:carbohydrate ABC transporter permease n=1 Tax=Variovorax sp. OV329 TaxID=1882825 RepID=UPI0008EEBA9B|nr:sugar ABC transporter permease [Variovorax sp. OV329]SFM96906.1 carbohydrate ABC transporter membrane protein 1, CUT1 family [Variovorax sp. OV329]
MTAARASYERQRRRFVWAAITPSLVVLLLIAGLPTLFLIVTSLTPAALVNPASLGDFSDPLRNYKLLGGDERFVGSLWVQARLSLYTVVLQVLLGTGLALMVNSAQGRWQSLRHLFVIPMVLPPIVVAVIWKLIYTPDISPIYQMARVLGVTLPALTTHVDFALIAIVIADTWEWAPFTFLMVLASLQTLPAEYVEAARMDGADAWRVFGHIVLPYIAPVLVVCTLFRLIDSIKAFPLIFLLTGGGPGTVTEVTNYYAYLVAFNFGELGYSSAITVVLLTATVVISWAAMRMSRRTEGMQ